MTAYRRNYTGNLFFLTLLTRGRRPILCQPDSRRWLRQAMEQTRRQRPWITEAIVLLPDHLHMLWRLPEDDTDHSTRISAFKKRFTRLYLAGGGLESDLPTGQQRHRLRGVWQRRFWEHTIRDARDFNMHLDYIHINPTKHGLATLPSDWPWSSFHRYVEKGCYESTWRGRVDLPGSTEYLWME